jgi:apolipoprotein N-acyltransferase
MIAGDDTAIIEHSGIGFGSLICFDSIYDELSRESVLDGAEVLAISTNDSWFDGSAALDMHNAQSILRAVENQRYVIRAANTGISSIINTKGEIVSSLEADTEGILCGVLVANSRMTLYTYIGNCFVYLCILTYIAIVVAEKTKHFHQKPLTNSVKNDIMSTTDIDTRR